MNEEIKSKWVAALRSGQYKQGHRSLRTSEGGFCCLGVLCDLHSQATGQAWNGLLYDSNAGMPSQKVWDWAGLPSEYGTKKISAIKVDINDGIDYLDSHNDQGATFAQIADAIEAQL